MNKCEKTDVCVFFINKVSSSLSSQDRMRLKVQYCITDKTKCARHMVNQKLYQGYSPCDENEMPEIERMANQLYPNDVELANRIIDKLCR